MGGCNFDFYPRNRYGSIHISAKQLSEVLEISSDEIKKRVEKVGYMQFWYSPFPSFSSYNNNSSVFSHLPVSLIGKYNIICFKSFIPEQRIDGNKKPIIINRTTNRKIRYYNL